DAADRAIHLVVAQMLKKAERARATDLDLAEGGFVEEAGVFSGGAVLGGDGGGPVLTGPPSRARASIGVRLEPVRPFPARFFTEAGAELRQALIGGGDAQRAPR